MLPSFLDSVKCSIASDNLLSLKKPSPRLAKSFLSAFRDFTFPYLLTAVLYLPASQALSPSFLKFCAERSTSMHTKVKRTSNNFHTPILTFLSITLYYSLRTISLYLHRRPLDNLPLALQMSHPRIHQQLGGHKNARGTSYALLR